MINPFLEFKRSMFQYDVGLLIYLLVVLVLFVGIDRGVFHRKKEVMHDCAVLQTANTATCFGMAAAWTTGNEGNDEKDLITQPKFCFVPNRDRGNVEQEKSLYIFPIVW